MELRALCIITFLSFFVLIKADQSIPSFLRFVGTYKYNTTDTGKITLKRYYVSQRVTYKWIDAFLTCKSIGMRLAYIENDDERKIIGIIARKNSKLFQKKVFVDAYNSTKKSEYDYDYDRSTTSKSCYSIQRQTNSNLDIYSENCNSESNKFLCEYSEVVDKYDDPNLGDNTVDVKGTFFTYIGNFGTKKYYASFRLRAYPSNVPKICHSFGMQMASPQNQEEYDNLGSLLQYFNDPWNSVTIAGYRSEENEQDWVVNDVNINYEINWNDGEPNNGGSGEYCLAMENKGIARMNDISCHANDQFICEFDESVNLQGEKAGGTVDVSEQSKLLKPLANYRIDSFEKELFVSLYEVDWLTASLTCKTFGMEFFTSSSSKEDEILNEKLKNSKDLSSLLHVGATSMGTSDVWYSINSGEVLDYDFEWTPYSDYNSGPYGNCLRLTKSYDKFAYGTTNCIESYSHFLCQRVVNKTGEVDDQIITSTDLPITSTSPAASFPSNTIINPNSIFGSPVVLPTITNPNNIFGSPVGSPTITNPNNIFGSPVGSPTITNPNSIFGSPVGSPVPWLLSSSTTIPQEIIVTTEIESVSTTTSQPEGDLETN